MNRMRILEELSIRGPTSFMALAKEIHVSGPNLSHHLEKLLRVELVVKSNSENPNVRSYRIYSISEWGKMMLRKIGEIKTER